VEKLPPGRSAIASLHVTSEALRVRAAVKAMEQDDAGAFGRLLTESHASLRDRLRVSCPRSTSWCGRPSNPARWARGSPARGWAAARWSSARERTSRPCAAD